MKKGFACPVCQEPMHVVKTRRRSSGIITRRRCCPTCGRRMTTEERPKGAISGPVQK